MSSPEQDVLQASRQLLKAIDSGDWTAYTQLVDENITCFEPEAKGHLVGGLPFHKYYFDLPGGSSPRQSTMVEPNVRMMGDVAIVCYIRLTQKIDAAAGGPVSVAAEETRVWKKTPTGWKHIHFHRSIC